METLALLLLAVLAVTLSIIAPRLMATWTAFRLCPGPALLLWQSVALAGILAALLAAPVAVWATSDRSGPLLWLAVALSAAMLARLLLSAHRVGSGLRALRRRHRDLVDVLSGIDPDTGVTVVYHESPTAYCVPGAGHAIVLSDAAVQALARPELRAVLAHERAHLHDRHDLILEFFTVLHHAVPRPVRCERALSEVHLLVEALADRAALRTTGARPLARALVTMHAGGHPDATLGVGAAADQTRTRLFLIADAATHRPVRAGIMTVAAAIVLTLPFVLSGLGV